MGTENKYIDEREVAKITGRAMPTLRRDRQFSRGIPYIKFGRSVRYSIEDVFAFMESKKVRTENQL